MPALPKLQALAAAALMLCAAGSQAMTLAEAYEAALNHDPQLQAAGFDLESARQNVPAAKAALMPQVTLSYSKLGVSGTRSFDNSLDQEVTTRLSYDSPQTALQMRMPLLNYEAWKRVDMARSQLNGAEATHRSRALDLADRLSSAYVQVLDTRVLGALADSEVVALEEQYKRSQQRLLRGEGTRTEEATALASLESARARATDARRQQQLALSRLARITGRPPVFVQDTLPDFSPQVSDPRAERDHIEAALANSSTVQVRLAAVETTRLAVQRAKAGHLPRIDAVANISRSRNESLSSLDQSTFVRSVGVQMSMPLYSGGGVVAAVAQAEADHARAEQELRNERDNVTFEVRRLLQLADSAAARAAALRNAVAAAEVAVTGATRAQQAGMGTLNDVLDARARLYAARRDLAVALYDHINSRSRLLVNCGESPQAVIDHNNALLQVRVDLATATPTPSKP